MTVVAVCQGAGTSAATTTAVLLAATLPRPHPAFVVECDPSGGDLAAWAQLPSAPGWATAVAGADRSWSAVVDSSQALPSGLRVVTCPARPSQARTAVIESAAGFAGLLARMDDVVAVADCGRVELEPPAWTRSAQLTLLILRQATVSAQATVARADRTIEALEVLRSACAQVGVVLIGGSPYPTKEVASALAVELFGVLPEDTGGAGLVCGGWTLGKRAARSPLAKAAALLGQRIVETIYGREGSTERRLVAGVPS